MFSKINESENKQKNYALIFFEATIRLNSNLENTILLNSGAEMNRRIMRRLNETGVNLEILFDSPCG